MGASRGGFSKGVEEGGFETQKGGERPIHATRETVGKGGKFVQPSKNRRQGLGPNRTISYL